MSNPLKAYLALNNSTAAQFAEQIGVSPSYLSRLIAGEREADATLLGKIERVSGGQVRPDMWVAWWRRATKERA